MTIRYSILGAGAMGSVFAARLFQAGCSVELLCRSDAHREAINARGLAARIDGNPLTLAIPVTRVELASPADVVILFTKSHQIDAALEQLPDSLRAAQVMTLQNGLGNAARVAHWVGMQRCIEGVTMMPAEFIGAGEVASMDAAETWFYHASGQPSELVDAVGQDFNHAGITSSVSAEVKRHIWQKACFNIAMNALCALTSGSPGLLQACPDGKALADEIADEALAVASAQAIELDANKVHGLIDYACAQHLWHRPSMLQDLDHGRSTEIEALNGYILQAAEQAGLAVPHNRMLARLIRIRQQAAEYWRGAPG